MNEVAPAVPDSPSPHQQPWPAIALARAHDVATRLPFFIADGTVERAAGSVARGHLDALRRWPDALHLSAGRLTLRLPAAERGAFFAAANAALRADGLIVAWRDETYPLHALDGDRALLATFERAAARFWGTLTFGAHCNGWVAGADGRPAALWIARRADNKPTDPGLLDNLIGGGVPHGQSPIDAVRREGWEEAGLRPEQMAGLAAGRTLLVLRDIPEGLQREAVSVFDLALPADCVPANQDGEVQSIARLPVAEALARAAAGEMTVNAALVTLDFALRQQLLGAQAWQVQHAAAAQCALWQA